ncbi:protein sprint-like [Daphnia carinata]|uniref:protein sprint-like n=1 Tax=Daphnia carinata TaxID=120202 RepID=UPI002581088B|nr:protein sprint-like [Daphnia carinata]
MSCASSSPVGFAASHFSAQSSPVLPSMKSGDGSQPSPAPRSSSYMLMLNSFASDLDSILSDLSTSPTLRGSQELVGSPDRSDVGNSPAVSCPDLPGFSQSCGEDAVDSSDIPLLERLIRSHPIWYLPNIQRVAAAQLLQNQEQGVFITRQSSQPGTLALSVKLTSTVPEAGSRLSIGAAVIGAGVQHYLIEAAETPQNGVRLESSDFVFDNLPALLAHYCQCCDELPVRLRLPARIRNCSNRPSLTSLASLGQEFWNTGENILTISTKRAPPVPPLRLSTFEPLLPTPTTPDDRKSHSPRLEARGSEPVPPPPPPRWCKPQLAITNFNPSSDSSLEPESPVFAIDTPPLLKEVVPVVEEQPKKEIKRHVQRRRKPRRRRSTAPLSPQCHHSSLADKASDYEDIWGTSPGASHDEDADEGYDPPPRPVILANEEDTALSDRPEDEICHENYSATSSSSNSTLEKMTSVSPERRPSISSGPESLVDVIEPEEIKPPSPFQEEPQRLSVTIIEIRNNPVPEIDHQQEDKIQMQVENKENAEPDTSEIVALVRRRTSCSSTESRGETNSRRTSPLYSEPADALPPELAWKHQQPGRPLPVPPFPSVPTTDFSTFTKDGYVRCTLPSLTPSQSNPRVNVLPPTGQRPISNNNRGKQVVMPKPPTGSSITTSLPIEQRKAFPSVIYLPAPGEDTVTIQEVLTTLCPSAALGTPSPVPSHPQLTRNVATSHLTKQRVSAYDNLLSGSAGDLEEADEEPDERDNDSSDDGTVTEFSEPWDSARWDRLLSSPSSSIRGGTSTIGRRKRSLHLAQQHTLNTGSSNSSDGGIGTLSDFETLRPIDPAPKSINDRPPSGSHAPLSRTRSFKDKMDPLLASPRLLALRSTCNSQAGRNLQVLILQLGRDCTTTFGRSLQNFLQCTREAKEQRAAAVLRNVRQFISGIKNFLVQHGEPAFDNALLDIRAKLKSNEFLNVDVVLELVLHQLVTLPLRSHLYKLLGQEALAAGSVQQLLAGIRVAREIHPSSLGLKEGQTPPSTDILDRATASMERLQRAASPLDKLEQLLDACTVIYNHAAETCGESVAAEDFLPLLAWLLAHCGFSTAEMEADFMWALLQPSLLAGEGGYFLTALSSAAQLLKNLQSRPASPSDCGSWMGTLTSIPGGDVSSCTSMSTSIQTPCVLRVLVADENQSSLLARTVPLRPSMTVRDVTKLLALKLRLSNPQDFTLVALVDGQEIQLPETENPQTWILGNAAATAVAAAAVTAAVNGGGIDRPCTTFAFRRQDAKIAWPRQING